MTRLAHLGLAVLGAALAVPGSARAGDYPPSASPSSPTPGVSAAMAAPAPAATPAPLDHKHYGRVKKGLVPCERCAAAAKKAQQMAAYPAAPKGHMHKPQVLPTAGMPEGSRIVGCEHSANGVCASCKALLEMPGEVVVVAPGGSTAAPAPPSTAVAAAAPGRSVATDAMPGRATVAAGDPEPIGVMQTNYTAQGPAGSRAKPAAPAAPARPGSGPFLGEQHETKPHILGHLFGFTEMRYDLQDKLEEGNKKKRAKHAAVSYDATDGKVQEIPASMVYGPGGPR